LRVQGSREGADAVIEGVIKSFSYGGVLLDDRGRARIFEVTIEAAVTVRDQTENRVLYDNQNFVFRGEYEFANDPRQLLQRRRSGGAAHGPQLRREYCFHFDQRDSAPEMTTLSRTEFDRSLKAGSIQPLYLLVGCEGYLREHGGNEI